MKRKILFLSLALLSTLVFTTCDNEHPEIDIRLERDFTEVIQAINDSNKSLSDKLALIEAMMNGTSDRDQSLLELVRDALSSLSGTVEEKLGAIQEALKSRNTTLETKLALIQSAIQDGFADYKSQQDMLLQALQSLEGTAEEKLAAIESAIKSQTSSLETKLGLIEAALKSGFADSSQANSLLVEAINSVGETLEEKLAAIKDAVNSSAASLESKLALVETAVEEGFADAATQEDLIRQAVASLQGTMEEKLAAIESAMGSDNTGLDTKLDLISAALEQGIGDQQTAIDNLKTALSTTLQGLNSALEDMKTAIINELTALSGQLTTEELAKVFKDVADAVSAQAQSEEALLDSLQKAVADIAESLVQQINISFVGDASQTITVTRGCDFSVKLSVAPADAVLGKDKLRIQLASQKLFFREGDSIGAEPDHFTIKSLEPDPSAQGQYIVTISTNSTVTLMDESVLTLVYNYGKDDKEKARYVSTKSFPVTMMPRPSEALKGKYYPNASISMRDTIMVHENKTIVDTLGAIYYALGSRLFKTEDGKESRTYTAENLSKVRFVQPNWPDTLSIYTVFNKAKHFVYFGPYKYNHRPYAPSWDDFKTRFANDHEYQELSGKLALTDRWGATDSVSLSMKFFVAWTIPYEIVDTVHVNVKPGDFEWTGKTYIHRHPHFWSDLLEPWGFDREAITRDGWDFSNTYKGYGYTFKGMRLNLPLDPASTYLELLKPVKPVKGDQYQALGVLRLRVSPSDVDPDFKPTQILDKYLITIRVTKDDTD